MSSCEAARHIVHAAVTHQPAFRVDSAADGVFAGIDVAVLVALLVVASLLQLGSRQAGGRFSIEAAQAWGRSVNLLRLVEMLVYISGLGALFGILGLTTDVGTFGVLSFAFSLLTIVAWSIICVLSIRWFWEREKTEEQQ